MLFIGTQFSNLYTAVDTPARGRVYGIYFLFLQEQLKGIIIRQRQTSPPAPLDQSCASTTPVCPSAACFRSSTFHCLRETWYVIRGNGPRTYTTVGVFFIEQQCSVGTWDVPTLDLRHVLRATMCVCVCIHIYRHTNNPRPRSQPRARVPSSTRNCQFRARRL